jgi:hypothetical protein
MDYQTDARYDVVGQCWMFRLTLARTGVHKQRSSWPPNMPQQLAAQCAPAACRPMCPSSWPPNVPQQLAAQCAPAACLPMCPSSLPPNVPQQLPAQCAPAACRPMCPIYHPASYSLSPNVNSTQAISYRNALQHGTL